MKILINRKPIEGPWGGGNLLVTSFCKEMRANGHTILHQFEEDIDLIFMQDPRYDELGISVNEIISYKKSFPKTKVVHRVNECDARKGTEGVDKLLRECSSYTDHTFFVSNWMRNYHLSRGWKSKSHSVIYNGVNLDHFKKREKFSGQKINIVTHHWSSNRMKGFDVYEAIDDFVGNHSNDYTFSYIGRELGTFKNTKIINPLFGLELGEELSKYCVYISGSLFDPGPNHILESLACELPTYAFSDGGGASEFAGNSHTFDSIDNLLSILLRKQFTPNKSIHVENWQSCIKQYSEQISKIVNQT